MVGDVSFYAAVLEILDKSQDISTSNDELTDIRLNSEDADLSRLIVNLVNCLTQIYQDTVFKSESFVLNKTDNKLAALNKELAQLDAELVTLLDEEAAKAVKSTRQIDQKQASVFQIKSIIAQYEQLKTQVKALFDYCSKYKDKAEWMIIAARKGWTDPGQSGEVPDWQMKARRARWRPPSDL
jgi:hypothetical protein